VKRKKARKAQIAPRKNPVISKEKIVHSKNGQILQLVVRFHNTSTFGNTQLNYSS